VARCVPGNGGAGVTGTGRRALSVAGNLPKWPVLTANLAGPKPMVGDGVVILPFWQNVSRPIPRTVIEVTRFGGANPAN